MSSAHNSPPSLAQGMLLQHMHAQPQLRPLGACACVHPESHRRVAIIGQGPGCTCSAVQSCRAQEHMTDYTPLDCTKLVRRECRPPNSSLQLLLFNMPLATSGSSNRSLTQCRPQALPHLPESTNGALTWCHPVSMQGHHKQLHCNFPRPRHVRPIGSSKWTSNF